MLWGALENPASLKKPWDLKLFGVAEREAESLAQGEYLAQHSSSWNKDSAPAFPSRQRIQLSFGPH